LKSSKRSLPSNRYLSKSTFESNQIQNIYSLKSENDSLKVELSNLQNQIHSNQNEKQTLKESPKEIELFHFLRSQCNDQNPHEAGLVNIIASSVYNDNISYGPQNVLNFDSNNHWQSKNEPNQWILFDLKGKSFKMKQIRIHINNKHIPRNWTLEGSNDNLNWTTIHNQGEDERCNTPFNTITFDINFDRSFTFFKIVQRSQNYHSEHYCIFYSVEFIGSLI
jgi:hypothetical protein